MRSIQFFYKPKNPVPYDSICTEVSGRNFSSFLNNSDNCIIEQIWHNLHEQRGDKVFSKPEGLGSLYNIFQNTFTYCPTDFKTYVATVLSSNALLLSSFVYANMRVSVIGGMLKLADGSIFIQRRALSLPVCGGMIDSSIAGFCHRDCEGGLNFRQAVFEKLYRELGIEEEVISHLSLSGVHSSRKYDFSGTFDFYLETNLKRATIEKKINQTYIAESFFIPQERIPEFILEHYAHNKDMSSEGCATLLAGLEHQHFLTTADALRAEGESIVFGSLRDGQFISDEQVKHG